jgi:hypothetical protein
MKIIMGDLVNAMQGVDALLRQDLPVVLAFKLSRLKAQVKPEMDSYEAKRTELIKKHGAENKETGNVEILPGSPEFKTFLDLLDSVLRVEVEINAGKIKLADFGAISVPGSSMTALFPFIEDEAPAA